jgi:methionine S-methyltransferase
MQPKSVNQFIQVCQESSQAAYNEFKVLLDQLDNIETRKPANDLLRELQAYFHEHPSNDYHFQFLKQNILDKNDQTHELSLIQFPSTFLPEAWSFTFYEGLVRYPASDYEGQTIVELGCGIGWISIALAYRYSLKKIIGLDLNPKAIICARLNLYLNGLNEAADVIYDHSGQSLLKQVGFFESNLFSHFNNNPLTLNKVIGCIPQVLNPEPEVMETLVEENASDEYLQSLSNYATKQGTIEDQFGLGLIATAVESAIPLMHPSAKLILNLGGRPGQEVIERLMLRRGFNVRRVWKTYVEQAADTEINALVDIEKNTEHRFEFYMDASAGTPINARTALSYAQAGGRTYHSVDVYEARLIFPARVKSIFNSMTKMSQSFMPGADKELSSAIDLTYQHYNDAEERYSFLDFFAKLLLGMKQFPYESSKGLGYFRQQLAEYFRFYLNFDINQDSIFISPGRRELITSLLECFSPELTLINKSLSHLINNEFENDDMRILETPSQVEYLVELINHLKPNLVVTRLDEHEIRSSQTVQQLVQCAIDNQCLLVIDLTDSFDLSSQPEINGIYRYLSNAGLNDNIVLIAALNNNRVYENYTLNVSVTNNATVTTNLMNSAELTYCRTPVLKQYYYAHLLEELLFFQRSRFQQPSALQSEPVTQSHSLALSKGAKSAFEHPAIQGNYLQFDKNSIRLDFGENELDAPAYLKKMLFESYLVRRSLSDEDSLRRTLNRFLSERFGLTKEIRHDIVFGNGVAPIFNALLTICARSIKQLHFTTGSYGYFRSAAQFKNIAVNTLETLESNNYKLNKDSLNQQLSQSPGGWLFLNGPIVNPTGAVYSSVELVELLEVALTHRTSVILDSIFCGLAFGEEQAYELSSIVHKFSKLEDCHLVIIGGISKEYAAGGLRFGYAWSTSDNLMSSLDRELPHKPHFTLRYAIKKVLEAQLNLDEKLMKHLRQQKQLLKQRAKQLTEALSNSGWRVIPPQGGLFLVAKPAKLIEELNLPATQGGDLATTKLFENANIAINNSTWTGLPGYCRFVLSCSQESFDDALERINNLSM